MDVLSEVLELEAFLLLLLADAPAEELLAFASTGCWKSAQCATLWRMGHFLPKRHSGSSAAAAAAAAAAAIFFLDLRSSGPCVHVNTHSARPFNHLRILNQRHMHREERASGSEPSVKGWRRWASNTRESLTDFQETNIELRTLLSWVVVADEVC